MTTIVKNAGIAIDMSFQSISDTWLIIKKPTMTSAGVAASYGTIATRGAGHRRLLDDEPSIGYRLEGHVDCDPGVLDDGRHALHLLDLRRNWNGLLVLCGAAHRPGQGQGNPSADVDHLGAVRCLLRDGPDAGSAGGITARTPARPPPRPPGNKAIMRCVISI